MRAWLERPFMLLLLKGDTQLLRVFFSAASLGMALWVACDPNYADNHPVSVGFISVHAQIVLFMIHGFATWYGNMTHRYSVPLLFCEGWLGFFLWGVIGWCEMIQQGSPGPMLMSGGTTAAFLLFRYPTHNVESR